MKKHNFNAGPSILPREVIENTAYIASRSDRKHSSGYS